MAYPDKGLWGIAQSARAPISPAFWTHPPPPRKPRPRHRTALQEERCTMVSEGTQVDLSIVAAPCSTKNRADKPDREMHQTWKGNKSFFGMKAHNNADADCDLVHSVAVTPANVHYLAVARLLLHGDEVVVDADPGTETSPDGATPPDVARMVAMPPGRGQCGPWRNEPRLRSARKSSNHSGSSSVSSAISTLCGQSPNAKKMILERKRTIIPER